MLKVMIISESFQTLAIIGKLLLYWKEFKYYLKHKWKEMTLEYLIVRLRIEKTNHTSEKSIGNLYLISKIDVME